LTTNPYRRIIYKIQRHIQILVATVYKFTSFSVTLKLFLGMVVLHSVWLYIPFIIHIIVWTHCTHCILLHLSTHRLIVEQTHFVE